MSSTFFFLPDCLLNPASSRNETRQNTDSAVRDRQQFSKNSCLPFLSSCSFLFITITYITYMYIYFVQKVVVRGFKVQRGKSSLLSLSLSLSLLLSMLLYLSSLCTLTRSFSCFAFFLPALTAQSNRAADPGYYIAERIAFDMQVWNQESLMQTG